MKMQLKFGVYVFIAIMLVACGIRDTVAFEKAYANYINAVDNYVRADYAARPMRLAQIKFAVEALQQDRIRTRNPGVVAGCAVNYKLRRLRDADSIGDKAELVRSMRDLARFIEEQDALPVSAFGFYENGVIDLAKAISEIDALDKLMLSKDP